MMKRPFFLLGALFGVVAVTLMICVQRAAEPPIVAVVLMVKNEVAVLEDTLLPFIKAGVQHILVFDTGSTDGTQAVAQKLFERYGLPESTVVEEPFIDFAQSRNRALEVAEKLFPKLPFMLMPDAEWYAHNVSELLAFCHAQIHKTDPTYLIHVAHAIHDFYAPRLFRTSAHVRFYGAVHETVTPVSYVKAPTTIYFDLGISQNGRQKSQARWQRDLILLKKQHQAYPEDARTLFYLGQTARALEQLEAAHAYLLSRTKLHGWPEEDYLAWYFLGKVTEALSAQQGEIHAQFTWSDALTYYLEASAQRPHRAEPLVAIAHNYFKQQDMHLCYLFARRACELPFPKDDMSEVEKQVYDFTRFDILGACAGYIGTDAAFEIGEQACRQALKARPGSPSTQANLQQYLYRKKQVKCAHA